MPSNARKLLPCLVIASSLFGCGSDDDSSDAVASRDAVVKNYTANLYRAYSDSVSDTEAFQEKIASFLDEPSDDSLAAARTSWLASREHYMLTEGARFYGGPIDGEIDGAPNYEGLVNSWPLDENRIDYSTDAEGVVDETVGIVNMPDELSEITAESLDELNGVGADENITAGWHAVEFLLWGHAMKPVGPGERPYTDYVEGGRANAARRSTYLKVAVDGIVTNLVGVRDAWKPTASYRVAFESKTDESLANMFTGLAKFSKGELGSERIRAAYTSKERRDQHDCFSSETLTDYLRDAKGIQLMYLGDYGDNDGPGLDELVKAKDPALDADLKKKIQASIDAIEAIPAPFEDAIAGDDESPGRVAIQKALAALSAQGDTFGQAAAALGLSIMVDDPEE